VTEKAVGMKEVETSMTEALWDTRCE